MPALISNVGRSDCIDAGSCVSSTRICCLSVSNSGLCHTLAGVQTSESFFLPLSSTWALKHRASVYDYIYVLFWNSIFTVAPVVGLGVFDRILGTLSLTPLRHHAPGTNSRIDYDMLMAVPELYRYGRQGAWFSLRSFFVYMMDALLQVSLMWFLECGVWTDGWFFA